MDKDTFQQEVYNVVAAIPSGRVVTYGQIAYLVGRPQCSRMVGHAMHDVPDGMCLPCHRVVNSQGRLAPCWAEQRALLEAEGVTFRRNGCVDMKKCQWEYMKEQIQQDYEIYRCTCIGQWGSGSGSRQCQ